MVFAENRSAPLEGLCLSGFGSALLLKPHDLSSFSMVRIILYSAHFKCAHNSAHYHAQKLRVADRSGF